MQSARRAAAVPTQGTAAPTAKTLFDWAEYKYPDLFAPAQMIREVVLTHLGVEYTVRSYPNANHLGLTRAGEVYGLGPFTADRLVSFGDAADYASVVDSDRCNVYGSCEPFVTELPTLPVGALPLGDNQKINVAPDGTIYLVRQVLYSQSAWSNEYIGKLYLLRPGALAWEAAIIPALVTPLAVYPWGVANVSLPRTSSGTVYSMLHQVLCTARVGSAAFTCSPSTRYATTSNLWNYASEIGNVPPGQRSEENFDITAGPEHGNLRDR